VEYKLASVYHGSSSRLKTTFAIEPAVTIGVCACFLGIYAESPDLEGIRVTFSRGRLVVDATSVNLRFIALLESMLSRAHEVFQAAYDLPAERRALQRGP